MHGESSLELCCHAGMVSAPKRRLPPKRQTAPSLLYHQKSPQMATNQWVQIRVYLAAEFSQGTGDQ